MTQERYLRCSGFVKGPVLRVRSRIARSERGFEIARIPFLTLLAWMLGTCSWPASIQSSNGCTSWAGGTNLMGQVLLQLLQSICLCPAACRKPSSRAPCGRHSARPHNRKEGGVELGVWVCSFSRMHRDGIGDRPF